MWQWLHRHLFRNLGTKLVALVLALTLYAHVFANLPHLVIGGVAIWVGYRLASAPAPVRAPV